MTAVPSRPYPAHETARADQHYAQVGEELDRLIETYRRISDGAERARCLDVVQSRLSDPKYAGATKQLSHADHVDTLANLLTVALDRLAQRWS